MPLLVVLAVHANLCLAVRHPENTSAAREVVEWVVADLEDLLLSTGVLTEAQLAEIRRAEIPARWGPVRRRSPS